MVRPERKEQGRAVHQHQRPRAGSGHGAAALGQPEPLLLLLSLPRAQLKSPDVAGLECQPVLEAERRRRRAGTVPPAQQPPSPHRGLLLDPSQLEALAPGDRGPSGPCTASFAQKLQVASSPGRSWIIPDLAAHRPVSWLSSLRQRCPHLPNSIHLLTSSSQLPLARHFPPLFVFCPLLQGCFQSCIMWAPLLCPLYLCLVLHSHPTLILVETQDSSLTPNFLSVRLTWEGDSLLFPAL